MTQGNSEQGKLYTRFISNLKRIQYFGYFLVVAFSLIFFGDGIFSGWHCWSKHPGCSLPHSGGGVARYNRLLNRLHYHPSSNRDR